MIAPAMRIGYDAKRLFNNFTGLGNYSRTLVRQVQQMYPEHSYFLYTPAVRQREATNYFQHHDAFQVMKSNARLKAYWRNFSIRKQLTNDRIDLYHGLSNEIPYGMKGQREKTIVTIHDLIFKVLPDTYPAPDRMIYDWKCRRSCRDADLIIAISKNTKKDIVRFYDIDPDKIRVVYQSVDSTFWSRQSEPANELFKKYNLPNDYLLYVGSVEKRKNLELILDSLLHLPLDLQIPLLVVGKGKSYKKEMQQKVADLKLLKRVIWLDKLDDNNQLRALYQNARALVYPSLYEGFGLPVVEALLCKTPVITSDRSSLPEAGGPDSLYIDPENPESLSMAIRKILTDEETVEDMVKKGFDYARQHFNPEKVTAQLMATYRKVIGQNQ
jgi:glycosyltransferase involved in cell wall biosynthesis